MPEKGRYLAEINVTPLVDVVLVLLIIFMVTAPMMTKGIGVELPETTARPLPQKERPVIITVDRKGTVYLGELRVDLLTLENRLKRIKSDSPGAQFLLKADRSVPYGRVAEVMARIREAGITNLGLVTKGIEKTGKAPRKHGRRKGPRSG